MSRRILSRLMWAALAVLFVAAPVAAQQTGQVVVRVLHGETAAPLQDVNVVVLGTQPPIGGATNAQGQIVLVNVPVGERTITAQLIGYGQKQQAVTVVPGDEPVVVQIELSLRAIEIEGMVVTGTATGANRREVGNSVAVVTAEQIEKVGAMNFEDLLRGRALGVAVSGTPGQAGAGSDILLRGVNSITGRNLPLVYIDGVRMPAEPPEPDGATEAQEHASFLGSINPQDIERIEIVKGPAASVLYGTEAAAGVIQIFTKRGQAGAPRWQFSTRQGVSIIGHVGPEQDPTGLHVNDCTRQYVYNAEEEQFEILDVRDPGCPESGSWVRNAHTQDYNLSVSGGTQETTYRVSSGWSRENGVVDPQHSKNLTLRGNFTFEGFENFRVGINSMYSRRDIRWVPNGDQSEGLLFNVARGELGETPDNDDSLVLDLFLSQEINHFNSGVNVNFQQRDNLTHRMNLGLDYSWSEEIDERPWGFWNDPTGDREVDMEGRRLLTFDYAGSWNIRPLTDISTTLSWGGQYNQNERRGMFGHVEEFLGPGNKVLQNGAEITTLNEDKNVTENGGFFGQLQVGWKNRLFITGGLRADTHSSFGEGYTTEQNFTYYPRAQAAYTISDHDFWPAFWETMRMRVAYGESGEPPNESDPITLWQPVTGDDNKPAFIIINQGNPDIGPEKTSEIEIGGDASLFNSRISLTGQWYQQKTTDGRLEIDPPESNGIAEELPFNIAEWTSEGWEAQVELIMLDTDNLRLGVNGGVSHNTTTLERLNANVIQLTGDCGLCGNYLNRYRIGFPIPSLYGMLVLNGDSVGQLPVYTESSTCSNYAPAGLSADEVTQWAIDNCHDDHHIGRTRPAYEYNVGLNVTLFNRLSLDAFGVAQTGHVVYDDLAQEMTRGTNSGGIWPPCIPIDQKVLAGELEGLKASEIALCSRSHGFDEIWAEDASYFRMQSATLSYRVPESALARLPGGFSSATLQFQAQNLFTITGFSGLYPDSLIRPLNQTARGAGYILPPPRTYAVSVRVQF